MWGAYSSLPTEEYGYPDEMVYILWSLTMLIPALGTDLVFTAPRPPGLDIVRLYRRR